MSTDILVTVVIPTYKRSVEYLSRAVNSVRNQTYKNIEIVVIDDSPAEFPERVEIAKYMASIDDPRVRYYQNENNLGGSLSRNQGIDFALGQYITFLDDDDEYLPQKVEKQLAFMLENQYDMTFTKLCLYSSSGNLEDVREYSNIPSFDNETLFKFHLMKHLTGTPTFMLRAEKLREIGGFTDAKMGQEFYLMFKAIQNGLNIGYFPECHVKAYRHPGEAISTGKNKISGEKALFEFKKQYFDRMTPAEKRYIRFRHYAVMAVAYKRNNMYLSMLGAGVVSVFSAPLVFFKEMFEFGRKLTEHRNTEKRIR